MELKFQKSENYTDKKLGFNCTFMELKWDARH